MLPIYYRFLRLIKTKLAFLTFLCKKKYPWNFIPTHLCLTIHHFSICYQEPSLFTLFLLSTLELAQRIVLLQKVFKDLRHLLMFSPLPGVSLWLCIHSNIYDALKVNSKAYWVGCPGLLYLILICSEHSHYCLCACVSLPKQQVP